MKTADTAVNYIYGILTAADGIQIPVYLYTKPTTITPDEFIVLNALPISEGIMQRVIVNVNYHCKDIDPANGLPDIETLECRNETLMSVLEKIEVRGYHVHFESQEYHREPELGMHYSNIRLNVKLFNY
jgi:hypothetical protein